MAFKTFTAECTFELNPLVITALTGLTDEDRRISDAWRASPFASLNDDGVSATVDGQRFSLANLRLEAANNGQVAWLLTMLDANGQVTNGNLVDWLYTWSG